MMGAPDWARDGRDWPNRAASRFLLAGGLRWHVQVMGPDLSARRPVILLLHGMDAETAAAELEKHGGRLGEIIGP